MRTLKIRPRPLLVLGVVPLIYMGWDLAGAGYKFAFVYSGLMSSGRAGFDPSNTEAMVVAVGTALITLLCLLSVIQIALYTVVDRAVATLDETGVAKRIFPMRLKRWAWGEFAEASVGPANLVLTPAPGSSAKPIVLASKLTSTIDPDAVLAFLGAHAPHIYATRGR